jgi:hypothetical protein
VNDYSYLDRIMQTEIIKLSLNDAVSMRLESKAVATAEAAAAAVAATRVLSGRRGCDSSRGRPGDFLFSDDRSPWKLESLGKADKFDKLKMSRNSRAYPDFWNQE